MKPDIWKFVRGEDGTYAVFHNEKKVSARIPEKWFERQICTDYGFCGEECTEIRRQLDESGKCTLVL